MKKEDGLQLMKQLVEDFKNNEVFCSSESYKEAETRKRFIDGFFNALGWSVSGKYTVSPEDEDVLVEQSLDIEDTKKFVDYTFRINKIIKFFCEAKKPYEDLTNKNHIFQAKSYAFSQGIPFVILTNFKRFRLFDISTKPFINQPDTDLVQETDFIYTDYVKNFDYLWNTFSRISVEKGSLVNLYINRRNINIDEIKTFGTYNYINIKGSSSLDKEFLKDIQNWRVKLAEDIFENNIISESEINEVVQTIIDRIIFIRILEDREIEKIEILKELVIKKKTNLKEVLDNLCRELYKKYGGILFKENTLCNNCVVSDEILINIIENLYYPNSPYNFKYIKIEILGSIFEQYLGSRLYINEDNKVKLNLQEQFRKAGGVYYTPEFISEKIVSNTVIPLLKGTDFEKIEGLRLIDISCGSGSLLVKTYKYILNYYLQYILKHDEIKEKYILDGLIVQENSNLYKLTLKAKIKILLNNIYGVDKDRKAIEISKMSLYIVLLENEKIDSNVHELLPDLDENIKCGDSLVDVKYLINYSFNGDMNIFTWDNEFKAIMKKGGFDCIIGNPPYIKYQLLWDVYPEDVKKYWKDEFIDVADGNYDIYVLFMEKAFKLLKENGYMGLIVPNKFFITTYGRGIRKKLGESKSIYRIDYFGYQHIVPGVSTYTALIFLQKNNKEKDFEYFNVSKLNEWLNNNSIGIKKDKDILSQKPWALNNSDIERLQNKIESIGSTIKKVVERVFVGIQTNKDKVYMVQEIENDPTKDYIICVSKYTGKQHKFEKKHLKKVVKGSVDLKQNYIDESRRMRLIFPYTIIDGQAVLIEPNEYQEKYPYTWKYLIECKECLISRSKKVNGKSIRMNEDNWYAYIYPKNLIRYNTQKILLPSLCRESTFSYDENKEFFFIGSGTGGGGGYGILLNEKSYPYSYLSLLGILNSSVINFMINIKRDVFGGGYKGIKKENIDSLPIPLIKKNNVDKLSVLDQIEKISKLLIETKDKEEKENNYSEKKKIEREYRDLINENNKLVYKIYELSEDEIDLIENYKE